MVLTMLNYLKNDLFNQDTIAPDWRQYFFTEQRINEYSLTIQGPATKAYNMNPTTRSPST